MRDNICATSGKPEPDLASGTSGWDGRFRDIESITEQGQTAASGPLWFPLRLVVFAKKRTKRKVSGSCLAHVRKLTCVACVCYTHAPSKDGPAGIPTESRLCDRRCACALCAGLGGAAHMHYASCAPAPLHAMYAYMNNSFENVQVPCGPNPSPVFCSLFWN